MGGAQRRPRGGGRRGPGLPERRAGTSGGPPATHTATTRDERAPVHGPAASHWHASVRCLAVPWLPWLVGTAALVRGAARMLGPPPDTARSPQAWAALTVAWPGRMGFDDRWR